jgi:8-oxo-dGTP pyrophosphatase MutT (NUDIX family)
MRRAYGGVVIDLCGQVLLREAMGHHQSGGWTFAKGKPKSGESPEATALREVFEETGVRAAILARVPGCFTGSRTRNRYFLMLPIEDTKHYDSETLAIRWVGRDQAAELLSRTHKVARRARDLQVLKSALALFDSLFGLGVPQPEPIRHDNVTQASLI